jgi:acetyl esterase
VIRLFSFLSRFNVVDNTATLTRTGSKLDANVQRFVDGLGGPPIYTLSPEAARKVLDDAQAAVSVVKMAADVVDTTVPSERFGDISVRVVRPKGAKGTLPGVLYIHGGGWILGNKDTHDRLVREIANGANAAVVFVNYTPSPEAKYPTALEQSYDVATYLVDNGLKLGVDPSRLAIMGDSVGGNMTAALTILAKERGGPKFRYQVLFYPVTDAKFDTDSYREFAEGPWLTKKAMEWFWNAYQPDVAARSNPTASPLRASISALQGLPPALIVTDENDVLRDEGEAYAHKLMQAGVPVKAMRAIGEIHDFAMLNGLAEVPGTRAAIALANSELRQALS